MTDFSISERPQTLDEFVGNNEVVSLLKNMFKNGTVPQTILLSAPAGSGKSTMASIIRKSLNVSDANFHEVDVGRCNSIEDIRTICDEVSLGSIVGGNRFYFLDEAHKLKSITANALLKTIEEPPKGVYFVFATTEIQALRKLGDAFMSRFTVLTMQLLSKEDIISVLRPICVKYKVKLTKETAYAIAEASKGCPRVALKLLYKLACSDDPNNLSVIDSMEAPDSVSINLFKDILFGSHDFTTYKKVASYITEKDTEPIRIALLNMCKGVLENPFNENSLRTAVTFVETFKEPCYDTTSFLSNLWIFFKSCS